MRFERETADAGDWHTGCFDHSRKEQSHEDQNQFEGWAEGRRPGRELMIVSERKKGAKAMKIKTNFKAGSPTLPLPPPQRF